MTIETVSAGIARLHYVLINANDRLAKLQLPFAQVIFIHHVIVSKALDQLKDSNALVLRN